MVRPRHQRKTVKRPFKEKGAILPRRVKPLRKRLIDFLMDDPKQLGEIYAKFKGETQTTIRGRLNESIGTSFKRITRGTYVAIRGEAKALIIEGDSWKVIREIEDNSMDVIITDSGYSILNDFLKIGTTRKLKGKWSFPTRDIDEELLTEFFRVLKPGGHFFSFLPTDTKQTLKFNQRQIKIAEHAGFIFNKRFIWDKVALGLGYHGRARYEQIMFFSKGKRRMPQDLSIPDVLTHKRIAPARRIHEAEKPTELLVDLILFSTKPGEWVFDPFGGSLNIIEAAMRTGRHSVGIEIHKGMVRGARKRFGARRLPPKPKKRINK